MDYEKFIVQKIKNMGESQTIAIGEKAQQLKQEGVEIISFAMGEPDFDTPHNIKAKAVDAINAGYTKYTAVAGIDTLKAAICRKLEQDNTLHYSPEQILVSCGGKHTLYNISQAIFDTGDEVVVLSPHWVTYPAQVSLAGASPVFVDTTRSPALAPTADDLSGVLTKRTRAVIFSNPSNPSGKVYTRDELEVVAQFALKNDLILIADEMYEQLVYGDNEFISIASLGDEIKERTITVNGVSKAYAMTGWRIGYAAGPREIIKAMTKIQGQMTSNPNSIAQYAAKEALMGDQRSVEKMRAAYQQRRDYVVKSFNEIDGVTCRMPEGAFYAFPHVAELFAKSYRGRRIAGSVELCSYLLEEGHVALVPGAAFGCDEYIRLSYAADMESIRTGLNRIKQAVEKLTT
ncbi:MAG: pyridoxal phosphate-dependent aminotransferase [Desulfobacterales bacterium]|nr:pyridoxal phosphate-dependent aminotransferase [Desulfobacterales bacterium]